MTTQGKIEYIADHYGFEEQSEQLIEEMGELTVAIKHFKRAKKTDILELIEELADVEIMVRQLKHLVSPLIVDAAVMAKLDRQLQRIEEEKEVVKNENEQERWSSSDQRSLEICQKIRQTEI